MRLTRHRHHHGPKAPRVAISQEEITADLIYPARPSAAAAAFAERAERAGSVDERRSR
jgi:hypothetical protein